MTQPSVTNKPFWILSLSGGGYRGLYSATILDELEKTARQPLATKFDLIAGTSVGGIIGLALAKKIPAASIRKLFEEHGPSIFGVRKLPDLDWKTRTLLKVLPKEWVDTFHEVRPSLFNAKYDAAYVKGLLENESYFGDATFGDLQHRIIVPSVNYTKGEPQFFKTPHHQRFDRDTSVRLVNAALATSAAPTYFPIHRFNDCRYVDGGLIANDPTLVAVHEAVHVLQVPLENVHVLSIGTMNTRVNANTSQGVDFGLAQWRGDVFHLTINAQEAMTQHMMRHALDKRYVKLDTPLSNQQAELVGFDKVSEGANEALRGQAKTELQKMLPNSVVQDWMTHQATSPVFYHGNFVNT